MDKNLIGIISPALFPGTAGDTANYSEVILQLVREGCDVVLICPKTPIEVVNRIQHWPVGMIVERIQCEPPRLKDISKGKTIHQYLNLLKFLTYESYTVYRCIKRMKVDVVFMRHSFLTLQLPILLKLMRIRMIADGELFTDSLRQLKVNHFILFLLRRYEQMIVRSYEWFKVSSESQAENLQKIGLSRSKILVIPISINTDRISRVPLREIPVHSFGYFGALEPWQGLDMLLKSFRLVLNKIPTARLYLIGDGSLKTELVRLANELGISQNMIFVDALPREEIWNVYFRKFRVVVIPRPRLNNSIDFLPSIKLAEALAAGKPVITTDIPAMCDYPGDAIILVPSGNIEMLAKTMERASMDQNLLFHLEEAAIEMSKRYDIKTNIKKLIVALKRKV